MLLATHNAAECYRSRAQGTEFMRHELRELLKTKNPIAKNDESNAAGKTLYMKHCKSCHGAKGLGDGPKSKELDTPCGDFTTKDVIDQTDGELFYKIKEGRDDMPSFKKKITDDEEIWSIVNFMRTLEK